MTNQASILVVDDDPRWLQSLSHVLTAAGYGVWTADGGEPAVAMVEARLPDLILLDIRMPGMDGFEVLRRLKAREESRAIPVLLISAFAEVDERVEGLKLGAVDSITKPFHAGELLARIRMQLELCHLRAEHAAQTAALHSANEKLEREIAGHRRAEDELREGEARLDFALETLTAGAWDLDLVDHTAHRTLLHDRIFGYETLLPTWTYEMFLEHVLPEDRADVDRCFREATEAHCDWGFECRIRRADGEVRWIWAIGSHERNAEGKPVRMAGVVQDITDRRAVEESLRESETSLAITLQSIGDAVIATDVNGRITRMNPVAERLTGWPLAEAEGRPMAEVFRIVNAGTRNPVENPVELVIERGVTVGLANHTVLLARDGREYQIADSAAPIRDPYGEILGVVLVFSDVTGRYEAEARIARLTHLYAALSQCNQAIVHSSSVEELLPEVCSRVVEFGAMKMAWIGMVDEATGIVRPVATYGSGTDYLKGIQITTDAQEPSGRGPTGTAIRENRPIWCQDYANDPSTVPWHEHGTRYGWRAAAALPLRKGGKPAGALVVYSDKTHVFDEEVRKLLEEMADDIGFALDSFDNEAERKNGERIMQIRLRLLDFSRTHPLEDLLVATLDEAEALSGSLVGFYHFLGEDQKTLLLQAWSTRTGRDMCKAEGKGRHYDVMEAGVWVDCIHQRRPVIHNDYTALPHCKGLPPGHAPIIREMVVPVFRNDKIVAILGVGNKPQDYTEGDVQTVSRLADMAWDICERRQAEEALIESEATMRYIVKHDPTALAIFDNGLRYIAVSDRFLQDYNVREEDILGRHHYEVFPEITQTWRDVHQRCLAGAIERSDDDRFERPDGSTNYLRWECRPWYRKAGAIGGIIIYSEIITERKMAEEKVKASERDLSRAQAIAHLGNWSWDTVSNRVLWSDEMFRIYGVDPATFDATAEGVALLIHPEDLWKQERAINEALSGLPGQPFDYRVIRPDGTERVVEVSSVQLETDPEGRPLRMFGVAQDITERRQADNALRESEERFRLMLQHIPSISVQGYQMDGTTHYWNDASEALYGYSAEEAIGKSLLDLIIPPEMRDDVRHAIKTMGETLQPIPASELTLMRKDGSRVTVYSSHAVIRRHGREPEFFCIDIDLTDRKFAEDALKELNAYLEESNVRAKELATKAEAAAQAKSEFLALMSHELRTPLNGVLGFAELLSRTRLDEEQQEYTQTIFDSGTHLLDVVNDILDLASLEKGHMLIEAAPINVSSLVESSCRLIRKTAADKGLAFSFESAPDVPEVITGDMRRIRQILINLLGNAVKFTRKGSVVLRISSASLEGRPVMDFSVEDTGPGIPNEILGDLFKPFTQADSSVSRPFEGTGLGLTISLRLAEAMGGTLGVVSTPGQGSRFTFRFPLEANSPPQHSKGTDFHPVLENDTAAGSIFSSEIELPAPEDGLILVVEDEPSNRLLACKMLEHLNYRVETAVNGLEALEVFSPGKYAVILMDMQMPLMDGLEATRRIRERESGTRVPIIALTANVMPGDRERCLGSGMDDFLTKPFNLGDLSDKLAVFLKA
jgi:PAS domain S-box-containing protein